MNTHPMNMISFTSQFDKMRNFMLNLERDFEPLNYVAKYALNSGTYPPHNIYKESETVHVIKMALAGFNKKDVTISKEPNILRISGKASELSDTPYVHKGIANRDFERVFYLGDRTVVKKASMEDGMLTVEIEKVIPEEEKPRKIDIE
ncbi:MAG: Hsp20 family protein [Burkholderiaceae bacterium]